MKNEPSIIRMFEAMRDRVAAGEPWLAVIHDYGLCWDKRCTVENILYDHKAMCDGEVYYYKIFNDQSPSYHGLAHMYAELKIENERLKERKV